MVEPMGFEAGHNVHTNVADRDSKGQANSAAGGDNADGLELEMRSNDMG